MKKLNNIEEMDALFKQSLEGAKVTPPADVWSAVSSSVGANSGSVLSQLSSYFSSVTNVVKVALFAGGITTVGVVLYNANTENPDSPQVQDKEVVSNPSEVDETTAEWNENNEAVNESGRNNENQNDSGNEVIASNSNNSSSSSEETSTTNNGLRNETQPEPHNIEDIDHPADRNNEVEENRLNQVFTERTVCLGETVEFTSKEPASWYVNGVMKMQNSETFTLDIKNTKSIRLTHITADAKYVEQIRVVENVAEIFVEKSAANYYNLKSNAPNGAEVVWTIDGEQRSSMPELSLSFLAGSHTVVLQVKHDGCVSKAEQDITVERIVDNSPIEFKNVFTPNGDGYNDTYSIPQKEYESFQIQIVNLRGEMVYQSNDPSESWNGTLDNKGTACAAGEYVAYIVYKLPGGEIQKVNQPLTLIVQ